MMRLAISAMLESKPEPRSDGKPPPLVGAVLLYADGRVRHGGRGKHRDGEHAEYGLLEREAASDVLDKATLYTTLEPCAKGSRKLPKQACAKRIIQARIARVVVGIRDPDPTVNGRGIRDLRDSGVEIEYFPPELQEEINQANKAFLIGAKQRAEDAAKKRKWMWSIFAVLGLLALVVASVGWSGLHRPGTPPLPRVALVDRASVLAAPRRAVVATPVSPIGDAGRDAWVSGVSAGPMPRGGEPRGEPAALADGGLYTNRAIHPTECMTETVRIDSNAGTPSQDGRCGDSLGVRLMRSVREERHYIHWRIPDMRGFPGQNCVCRKEDEPSALRHRSVPEIRESIRDQNAQLQRRIQQLSAAIDACTTPGNVDFARVGRDASNAARERAALATRQLRGYQDMTDRTALTQIRARIAGHVSVVEGRLRRVVSACADSGIRLTISNPPLGI